MRPAILLAPALLLAACHGGNTAADRLDQAADQSDPAAADVLHNQADALRDNGADANSALTSPAVQNAMTAGGEAAAANGSAAEPAGNPPHPSTQAKPHAPGDPVPPPQTR